MTAEVISDERMGPMPDGDLRLIPIDELTESPWNPRKHFPPAAMAELTDSMRTNGFRDWLPLLVRGRPASKGFEIGAGHRRSRAARAAGITMIPCIVREMTDEQFLEVLNFDNTGREDVHPLEEAAGWRHLMEQTGKSVLDIAARIGKSKEYVYQGLKYDALIPEVRQTFIDRGIKAGHAILLARLSPELQMDALREGCFDWQENLVSTRTLARWIQQKVNGADLSSAPFDRNDAALVAIAGSCAECPKCQGDLCMDRACYDGKVAAHIALKTAGGLVAISESYNDRDLPAGVLSNREFANIYDPDPDDFEDDEDDRANAGAPQLPAPEPTCQFAEEAVVAHGGDLGKVIRICRNPQCPEHGSQLSRFAGIARTEDGKKDLWAERAKALPQKIKLASRRAVLAAVLRARRQATGIPYDQPQVIPHEQLQLIAEAMVPHSVPPELIEAFDFPWSKGVKDKNGGVHADDLRKTIRAPKGSPASDYLPCILLGLALLETAKEFCYESSNDVKRLYQAAELLKVDAKAIAANVAYNLNEDFKWRRAAAKAKKENKPEPERPKLRAVNAPAEETGTRREVIKQLPAVGAAKKAAPPAAAKPAAVKKPAPAKKAAAKKKGGKK